MNLKKLFFFFCQFWTLMQQFAKNKIVDTCKSIDHKLKFSSFFSLNSCDKIQFVLIIDLKKPKYLRL